EMFVLASTVLFMFETPGTAPVSKNLASSTEVGCAPLSQFAPVDQLLAVLVVAGPVQITPAAGAFSARAMNSVSRPACNRTGRRKNRSLEKWLVFMINVGSWSRLS